MAKQLPCPNPACQHVFSPAEVQGATALVCPRCGTRFQFRTASLARPAAPPLAPPLARPVRPAAAEPFPDTVVLSAEQAPSRPAAPPSFTDDSGPLVRPRYQPRRSSWLPYALLGGALIAAALIVVVVVMRSEDSPDDKGGDKKAAGHVINGYIRAGNKDEQVFRLALPEKTWSHEPKLKEHLKASVALKRSNPQAWLAVAVKDFGGAKPRDAQLLLEAKERLDEFFGDFLELSDKVDKTELAGQTAQRMVFKGKWPPGTCRGECVMLSQRGLGYWLFLLAPAAETVQEELAGFLGDKKSFALVDQRTGWREQGAKMEVFAGSKLSIAFQAPEGVWEKFPPLADEERIDLYLSGKYLKEKDNRKNASAIVLALDKQDDSKEAMKAARDWLEKKKKDEAKHAALVLAGSDEGPTQEDLGTLATFGNRRGRYLELRLQAREMPISYLLLAVVPEPDKTLVISCECTWENRLIWRQEFLDLLATLTVKTSE